MSDINQLVNFNLIIENAKPDLKEGQYAVVKLKKLKNKKINPKTNRIKTFKTTDWIITNIALKDRTLKNRPRYADGKVKVKFQDWLEINAKKRQSSHAIPSYGWAANGKCYGWSHRAIYGFKKGDTIKPGQISYKNNNKKPYTIKTDKEAEKHAIRFAESVS